MVSPLSFALANYGLERPSEDTEIHVFRVILQTSLDKKACTRSVTPAGPMSDPLQTLEQIIEEWWDLEVEEQNHSWTLTAVNRARTWSPNKDLLHPVYVLTRKGDPFHLQRPHGVLEVSWGHRYWITAIALPKWINNYHCVGLLKNACGPLLSQCCAMWCDDTRLREELVECHIGSFVQVHIETFFSDLVRIDLQAALQRSIDALHLLLLSQWIRLPRDDLHIRHATNSWLSPDKVKVALGPDCDISPHPVREVPLDLSIPYIDMLLGPQKADRGHANNMVKQEESQTPDGSQTQTKVLPALEEVLVTLRLQVDSCRPAEVSALIQILLGGTPVRCRNRQLWIQAVQDYFEDVPLCVPCRKLLQLVWETSPQMGCKVYLVKPDGSHQAGDLEALCRGSVPFPGCGVHVHIRTPNAVVGSASCDDPQLVNIDCTGLGGHDSGGFKDYDICLRTDKHSQSIYGPSVTPLESPGRDGTHQVTLVALGGSKAMHEFLVLHYLATDSAQEWDVFLDSCLPRCT